MPNENSNQLAAIVRLISQLEEAEEEYRGHVIGEKLSGNVVKEALYQGTVVGLRISILMIREKFPDLPPAA